MVESSGLLNRRRVKNSTGGSNPPLSASKFFHTYTLNSNFVVRGCTTKNASSLQSAVTVTTAKLRILKLDDGSGRLGSGPHERAALDRRKRSRRGRIDRSNDLGNIWLNHGPAYGGERN